MTAEMPEIFKALLEYPFSVPTFNDDETDKEKLCLDDDADLGSGGSGMGPSAALTPAIWEKTIPYDGENFHLEYMDLEEFLMENGIPTSPDDDSQDDQDRDAQKTKEKPKAAAPAQVTKAAKAPAAPVALMPILELDQCEEEVVTITMSPQEISSDVTTEVTTGKERATPELINPDDIEVDVKFEPDPTDLVLSSVPGGELFNPRKHKFSEEELKPQPMIKKAKKVFVPEEQKDEKYWQRRRKNNVAAKRSRDARRLKENQITVRAAFLERENTALRTEVAELRKECGRYKNVVARYAAKYGQIGQPEDL
ncbi:TEF transcription factor, PAR bZIP family member a isoform X2 [Myripristis murdjan]|uniref:TEF transcription factor, PAR bZIP family member a isoform X2 n=1 Tax=Myripristis murdjan TaxID=586833 RepID=UPI0011762DCF|nr:thyrotroph embryonic factor-like isoform X2 [Myripristis murdjan]